MADTVTVQGSSSSDLSAVVHRVSYVCTGTEDIKIVLTYGSVFSDVFCPVRLLVCFQFMVKIIDIIAVCVFAVGTNKSRSRSRSIGGSRS